MVNTWWNSHTIEYNALMWASNLQLHMMAESQKVIVGKDARYKILHFVWFVDKKYKADKANLCHLIWGWWEPGDIMKDVWSQRNVLFYNQGAGYTGVLSLWKLSIA